MAGTDERTGTDLDDGPPDHASGLALTAERHGVSLDAVRHLLRALERGGGRMAQFDHPDLGGMGQWSAGGATMVGRMFDDALKARVGALCTELAASLPAGGFTDGATPAARAGGGEWWPHDLGRPASSGSQDGMRYAYFPESRRLAVASGPDVALYDTGEHLISGVSQADGRLGFTGPRGEVALDRLRRIQAEVAAPRQADPAAPRSAPRATPTPPPPPATAPADVLGTIERLADLHARGILTDREFSDKKAELLARL